jgi:hypothetical protein
MQGGKMNKVLKVVVATILVLAMSSALFACGASTETKAAAGVYKLESITANGATVSGADIDTVAAAANVSVLLSLELFNTGKYKLVSMDVAYEGNFKIEGTKIIFTDGQDLTGTYENNTVTVDVEGINAVFKKQ